MSALELPVQVRLAQAVGISSAFLLSGMSAGASIYAIPAIKKSPIPLLLQQWLDMYDQGKVLMPPMCVVPTALFGYLAWHENSINGPNVSLYVTATLLGPSFITYTLMAMRGVNGTLIERATNLKNESAVDLVVDAIQESKGKDDTHALVDQWNTHNFTRAGMIGVAGMLALWASL